MKDAAKRVSITPIVATALCMLLALFAAAQLHINRARYKPQFFDLETPFWAGVSAVATVVAVVITLLAATKRRANGLGLFAFSIPLASGTLALLIAFQWPTEQTLVAAIERGDLPAVQRALRVGVSPDTRKARYSLTSGPLKGDSVLAIAASQGNLPMMRLLLNAGATVDSNDDSENPLYYAVLGGHREMDALLLDHGADIDRPHRYRGRQTAFVAAVNAEKFDMADFLLARGAKRRVDVVGTIDVDNQAREKLQYLVERDVAFDGADSFSHHPLLLDAVQRGREDVVEMLLSNNAITNVRSSQVTAALGVIELRIEKMQSRREEATALSTVMDRSNQDVPANEGWQQQIGPYLRMREMLEAARDD
jgi:hypothetical protein